MCTYLFTLKDMHAHYLFNEYLHFLFATVQYQLFSATLQSSRKFFSVHLSCRSWIVLIVIVMSSNIPVNSPRAGHSRVKKKNPNKPKILSWVQPSSYKLFICSVVSVILLKPSITASNGKQGSVKSVKQWVTGWPLLPGRGENRLLNVFSLTSFLFHVPHS